MSLNYHIVLKIFGLLCLVLGIAMLPSILMSYLHDSPSVLFGFIITSLPLLLLGILILLTTKNIPRAFRIRDGYFAVTFCWMISSLLGAFPYFFSGVFPNFVDALFESTAAFTTTGCSVTSGMPLPMGIVLWKATSSWLGGLSLLIFVVSILPALGINTLNIGTYGSTSPTLNQIKTKIADSSKYLYLIYISFTILEFILLSFSEMSSFEALINTLGSVSTNVITGDLTSIASYDSLYIESVITGFTFLASVNFMLYYYILHGKSNHIFRDIEFRVFTSMLLVSSLLISLSLYFSGTYPSMQEALRMGIFQTVSFSTTSGYTLTDYSLWPSFTLAILVTLMLIGGCYASTSGSFKVIRFIVIIRLILRGFRKRLHPRSVVAVRVGKTVLSAETVSLITAFAMLYALLFLMTCLVVSIDNLDMMTSITAAAGILSNTGLAFGDAGTVADFSIFSEPIRLFLAFMMVVGRLELFTVLILFLPSFWSGDR